MSRKTRNAKRARKERLFWQGVEAFKRVSGRTEDTYLCPLCFFLYSYDEIDELTIEHVPPESVGGKGMCLTCRQCNSTAGHKYDYAPAERAKLDRLADLLKGRDMSFEGRLKLLIGDIRTNAVIRAAEGGIQLTINEKINNPSSIDAQIEYFKNPPDGKPPTSFSLRVPLRFKGQQLIVSDLRTAYLAVFSFFGYALITRPVYNVVRTQITKSEEQIIKPLVLLKDNFNRLPDGRTISYMTEPMEGLSVYLHPKTRRMVLLPSWNSPTDFFERLEDLYGEGRGIRMEASELGWSSEPQFAIDAVISRTQEGNDSENSVIDGGERK